MHRRYEKIPCTICTIPHTIAIIWGNKNEPIRIVIISELGVIYAARLHFGGSLSVAKGVE